jgi:transcriptional regulator with XRE-family HTH domain
MPDVAASELLAEAANRRSLVAMLPTPERRQKLRRQFKITRVQVAGYLGVDHRTWDKIEKGTIIPDDAAILEKLSVFYRVLEGELEEIPTKWAPNERPDFVIFTNARGNNVAD